jgi:hypothetical protein
MEHQAIISPWIRELARIDERKALLRTCGGCGTGWFSPGFDAGEMDAIYSEYRGSHYLSVRSKWEPWYSDSLNYGLSQDHSVVRDRNNAIGDFLGRYISLASVSTVVDIGGDMGQFIPVGDRKFVLEASTRPLVTGVQRISSLGEVPECELIMSCHVLEHLSEPSRELLGYAVAQALYLEVPFGVPRVSRRRAMVTTALSPIASHRRLWRSTAAPAAGRIATGHFQPLRMSEHQNFFTPDGMRQMAERVGRTVIGMDLAILVGPDGANVKVLQVLAQ